MKVILYSAAILGFFALSDALSCYVTDGKMVKLVPGFDYCRADIKVNTLEKTYIGLFGATKVFTRKPTDLSNSYCYVDDPTDSIMCYCNIEACNYPMSTPEFNKLIFSQTF